jgi:hypothetical protein
MNCTINFTGDERNAVDSALIHRVFEVSRMADSMGLREYFDRWLIPEYYELCAVLLREWGYTPRMLQMRVFA